MPYCPKCDMEFVDGVTVCTDCGGPLVSSKEEYERMKKEEEAAAVEALQEGSEDDPGNGESIHVVRSRPVPNDDVYVSKEERYDDYSSSATAFIIVGAIAVIAAVLGFANVLPLPFYGVFRTVMLLLIAAVGVVFLIVALRSFNTARNMKSEVAEEKKVTADLISWFLENFTAEGIDSLIDAENGSGLKPEERALKRLTIIQDMIITNYDILDQSYADELAEEIYERMFDD